jgi:hypothetical protein
VPPVDQDTTLGDVFTWGNLDYDDLVAMATITINASQITVGPAVSGSDCLDTPSNWGDPLDPSSPCFGRLPIIHFTGTELDIEGVGQGIILGEGRINLETNGTQFYGLIAGKDKVYMFDESEMFGAIVGANKIHLHNENGALWYSSCALARAFSGTGWSGYGVSSAGPLAIDIRPWSAYLR